MNEFYRVSFKTGQPIRVPIGYVGLPANLESVGNNSRMYPLRRVAGEDQAAIINLAMKRRSRRTKLSDGIRQLLPATENDSEVQLSLISIVRREKGTIDPVIRRDARFRLADSANPGKLTTIPFDQNTCYALGSYIADADGDRIFLVESVIFSAPPLEKSGVS